MKLFAILATLLIPSIALAADGQQLWWQSLLANLTQVFVAIAVPVVSTLVAVLLKKWKIKVETEEVEKIAAKAAGWAEQKALNALRENGEKTSGAEKLDMALDFALSMADRMGYGKAKAVDALEDLIESHLGEKELNKQPAALQ